MLLKKTRSARACSSFPGKTPESKDPLKTLHPQNPNPLETHQHAHVVRQDGNGSNSKSFSGKRP